MAAGDQTALFLAGEGDNWYRRNAGALTAAESKPDWVCRVVREAGLRPARVLEVGAANGYRLERLRREYGCQAVGVDPSAEAVAAAGREFPAVRMARGVAHDLSAFPAGGFDLVVLNFVLHWVDRAHLLRAVAEADRVLAEGGHVAVGDFAPARPERVRYHHRPDAGAFTYKQDYRGVWLASGLYVQVAAVDFHHGTAAASADVPPADRARVALLRKVGAANYQPADRP